jgi:hypothetical protein
MSRWAGGLSVLALLALVVWVLMVHPWDGKAGQLATQRSGDGFAADRAPPDPVPFDAKRAMGYLEAICKIGPRISGTAGMKKQQELIEKHFTALGAKVSYQNFTAKQRSVSEPVAMKNLIVSWHPDRPRRVILCSHYDTRPIADQEAETRRWRQPFLSANDGGSGVALLMELGRHMKDLPVAVGVDFVFFDGEEYIHEPEGDEYFFGSRHFAQEYRRSRGTKIYLGALLLDMVGGKNAQFPIEQNSWRLAGGLVKDVWGIAEELHCGAFRDTFSSVAVQDDHLALNTAGIPAVDIIDFSYPHWHRLTDVPENCSGKGLEQVAQVLAVWLQRVK